MNQDEWIKTHITNANTFATEAIKAFLLLNGGAAVVLMTLLGATSGKDIAGWILDVVAMKDAIRWFGGGAMMAAFSAAGFYCAEISYAAAREGGVSYKLGGTMRTIAVLILISAALAFVFGLNNAAGALAMRPSSP